MFEKRDGRDEPFIKISDKFTLEDPKVCYEKLVSACSMISSYVKYDSEKVVQAENGGTVRLNIHLPRLESD
ncbi:hypothetical protein, partial [Faecalibacterium prausnitzii]|uniref:hypothetical protein n=1 Tax=Faecalibacterium prausnitzii TaxID=853 RepID=UPI00345FC7E4